MGFRLIRQCSRTVNFGDKNTTRGFTMRETKSKAIDEVTTKTDKDFDDNYLTAAGAVLVSENQPYTDGPTISAAGRLLATESPDEDDIALVTEGAKKIPKTRSAQRRDEEEKNSD